jgi:hypothetical protein
LAVFPAAFGGSFLISFAFGGIFYLDSENHMWPNWIWTLLLSACGALSAIGWIVPGTIVAPRQKTMIRWVLFATGASTAAYFLEPLFTADVPQATIVLAAVVVAGGLTALLFTRLRQDGPRGNTERIGER